MVDALLRLLLEAQRLSRAGGAVDAATLEVCRHALHSAAAELGTRVEIVEELVEKLLSGESSRYVAAGLVQELPVLIRLVAGDPPDEEPEPPPEPAVH